MAVTGGRFKYADSSCILYREGWLSWLVHLSVLAATWCYGRFDPQYGILEMILSQHGGKNIVSSNTMNLHFTLFYNFF